MAALALLLALLGSGIDEDWSVPAAPRCLPAEDGFLSMRLRGSIDEDVHWTEPALACTGMARPDGKGLRVRFAGQLSGGEFAIVFAAAGLGIGDSGRAVPVNVTLLDGAGERIYGTQGEDRCEFDAVEQRPIGLGARLARQYRISARGFCIAPARAVDGDGSVLLSRFDFAGLITLPEDSEIPAAAVP